MSTINLLPQEYIERRLRNRATVICSILFAVVMSVVIAAAIASQQSHQYTLEVRDRLDADYAEAAKLIQQMQQLEAKKRKLLHKAELSAALMERVPRSYVLAVVTNALPANASLENLVLDTREAPQQYDHVATKRKSRRKSKYVSGSSRAKAKPVPQMVQITVTGLAATDIEVARLIANLARNSLVETVDLIYSQEKIVNKASVREFQIRLVLKADGDAIDSIRNAGRHEPTALVGKAAEVRL